MSGVMPPNEPRSMESVTPQAIADLARSLEDAGPSPHVERALNDEWEARYGTSAVHRGSVGKRRLAWVWPGLVAAAAVVVAALWPGPSPPGRVAPAGTAQVGLDAAVPEGPLEPPPARPPAASAPLVQTVDGEVTAPVASSAGSSPRTGPVPARATPRHDVARVVRPGAAPRPANDEPEPFFWIRGADDIEPGLGVHLVRVQVPRLRWDEGTPSRELVDADVLMGNDGQARAVRVVRTGSQ